MVQQMAANPGDGADPAASAATPECRMRQRRRLAPPAPADEAGDTAAAGPSADKRARPASPSSSSTSRSSGDCSDSEDDLPEGEEEDTVGELLPLPPLLPPRAAPALPSPPPEVWPMAFGAVELQGRMREMEDTLSLHPALFFWADGSPMHFFAVFDGHGGPHVSALCRNQMHAILAEELAVERAAYLRRREEQAGGAGDPAATEVAVEEDAWRAALLRCFRRVDALAAIACACGRAQLPPCRCELSPQAPHAAGIVGSTAVVALLVRDRLVVANCGDSRAVLCRGPAGAPPVPLSDDHKPDRPDELARIEALGGRVVYNNGARVRGILAMSRALGDRFLRPEVISVPDITITQRTLQDECLILASDGMWDAFANELACNVARQCLEDGAADAAPQAVVLEPEPRCNRAAALLARLALGRGSQDNVTVVVIDLKRRGMAATNC
ncbi:hypothetical protein ACP70R_009231 [Stipagrostis hirtigluma subsp. patula]